MCVRVVHLCRHVCVDVSCVRVVPLCRHVCVDESCVCMHVCVCMCVCGVSV